MLLALHYWMRDAHHCSGPPISEMTYTVSSGTLSSTIPYHTVAGTTASSSVMQQEDPEQFDIRVPDCPAILANKDEHCCNLLDSC